MRAEFFLSLLNRAYRKKSILSQGKWTYNAVSQFKSVESDLKILGTSKFGSSAFSDVGLI